jgi:hypothetical protein
MLVPVVTLAVAAVVAIAALKTLYGTGAPSLL